MIWLAVLAIVVVGLLILGLSVFSVLRRLGPLARAVRRVQRRQADVEVLTMSVAHLQERVEAFAERAGTVAAEASQVRARRATLRPGTHRR